MAGGHGFGTDNLTLAIGMVSFCVVMVGAFASSEASILAANRLRIQQLAERGDRRARAFCDLRDNEDKMFATILAVENMFIIFGSSFGVSSAEKILGPGHSLALGFVTIGSLALVPFLLEFVIVLFGEITPKTYAARHSTRIALLVARPLKFVVNVLYPVIRFAFVIPSRILIRLLDRIFGSKENLPSITEEELKMIIDRSSAEGVLENEERDLLHNVFEFGDTVVSEVMTSRTHIVGFKTDTPLAEALPKMLDSGFSRFPVYSDSIDDIRGIIHLKEIFKAFYSTKSPESLTVERFLRPTLFIPEDKQVMLLLEMMQTHRIRTVIVADEFGGTEGLVTLKDLIREVFGDIENVAPVEHFVRLISPGCYRVQAQASIYDLAEEMKIKIPEGKYQTVAGFVLDQLEHIPQAGETFYHQGWDFIVTQVIGPKILEIEMRERKRTTGELVTSEDQLDFV